MLRKSGGSNVVALPRIRIELRYANVRDTALFNGQDCNSVLTKPYKGMSVIAVNRMPCYLNAQCCGGFKHITHATQSCTSIQEFLDF